MNFKIQASSHIRTQTSSLPKMMRNVIVALIPVVFISIVFFKVDYVIALVVSIVSVCGLEYLANKMMKKEQTLYDYSALVTAVIFSLTLPIGIFNHAFYRGVFSAYLTGSMIIVVSAACAIILGKMVFGGVGRNIFNPAGIGRIVQLISFGGILNYLANNVEYVTNATPLSLIKREVANNSFDVSAYTDIYRPIDLFIGRIPGSFGEVSAIAILFGAAYLIASKAADWRKIVAALGTFIILAAVYAFRIDVSMQFVLIQLLTGSILFGVVFMVTDPVTAPITAPGRVFYAMMIGGLTFIIRIFGAFPEGMLFSILIMNMFTPAIDYYRWSSNTFTKGWIITILVTLAILVSIIIIGTRGV